MLGLFRDALCHQAVVTLSVPLSFAIFDVVSGGKFKGVLDSPNDQGG